VKQEYIVDPSHCLKKASSQSPIRGKKKLLDISSLFFCVGEIFPFDSTIFPIHRKKEREMYIMFLGRQGTPLHRVSISFFLALLYIPGYWQRPYLLLDV
jgi:hypothetical protein